MTSWSVSDYAQALGKAERLREIFSQLIDEETIVRAARETGNLLVVEDHAIDGGLGDAVAAATGPIAPVLRLGIHELPLLGQGKGTPRPPWHIAPFD